MPRPKKTSDEIQAMRSRILDATVALIEEEGIAELSIRKIAQRVGVSHMVLYHYFQDREDLIGALRQRQLERVRDQRDAALAQAASNDSLAELRETLGFFVRLGHRWPRLYRLIWLHPLTASQERIDWGLDHLTQLIQVCIQEGTCAPRDPRLAAATALCMVNGPLLLHHSGRLPDEELLLLAEKEALQATMDYLTQAPGRENNDTNVE